jgi:hypothetical protein
MTARRPWKWEVDFDRREVRKRWAVGGTNQESEVVELVTRYNGKSNRYHTWLQEVTITKEGPWQVVRLVRSSRYLAWTNSKRYDGRVLLGIAVEHETRLQLDEVGAELWEQVQR